MSTQFPTRLESPLRLAVHKLDLTDPCPFQRVAAAWSRKDFPPPKLDAMFRCVEAVYRANRAFGNVGCTSACFRKH